LGGRGLETIRKKKEKGMDKKRKRKQRQRKMGDNLSTIYGRGPLWVQKKKGNKRREITEKVGDTTRKK